MPVNKTLVIALALLAAHAAAVAAAEIDPEFYVNTYRGIGAVDAMSARSIAMGRSGRGIADGVDSIGVNPAALGAFKGTGFNAALGVDGLDDGKDNTIEGSFRVGGAANLERFGGVGGGSQAIGGMVKIDGFSGAGNLGVKKNQMSATVAYGLHITDDILGGVSVSLVDAKWKSDVPAGGGPSLDRKFIGGDFKLGMLYRISDCTTLGGALGYTTGSLKEQAPYAADASSGSLTRWSLGGGIAHQVRENTLLLGDVWYERTKSDIPGIIDEHNNNYGLSAGVEQRVIADVLALRGGMYYNKNSYSASGAGSALAGGSYGQGRFGITAGAGVRLYGFDVGYALDINSGGDVKNQVDVSTVW